MAPPILRDPSSIATNPMLDQHQLKHEHHL
jgi:hypothetical protein